MARVKKALEIKTPDKWNDVVLSLATSGGYIISDGKMAEVKICAPKLNESTLVLENIFLSYWVEKRLLHQLYQDVYDQQDELNLHMNDKEEQERIEKEREEALILLKMKKNKKNKVIIEEPSEDPDVDDDDERSYEH